MIEGRCVVAGDAALNERANIGRSELERDDAVQCEDLAAPRRNAIHESIEALVGQHSRLVYRIAYAVLRRHQDAEDATQEAFLRVLRYGSKLTEVEDAKTWLARIAWRVAVDRGKAQGKRQETTLEGPEAPAAQPVSADIPADDQLHGSQVAAALEKLIAALPRKLREPLILSTVEEMSPADVAVTLSISEAAVRSRIFRARQILKEKLSRRI